MCPPPPPPVKKKKKKKNPIADRAGSLLPEYPKVLVL